MIAHLLSAMFFMRGKVWLRGLFLYVGGFVFRRPLSNCLTLRRLRGGAESASADYGGVEYFPPIQTPRHPPKIRWREFLPPPASGGG